MDNAVYKGMISITEPDIAYRYIALNFCSYLLSSTLHTTTMVWPGGNQNTASRLDVQLKLQNSEWSKPVNMFRFLLAFLMLASEMDFKREHQCGCFSLLKKQQAQHRWIVSSLQLTLNMSRGYRDLVHQVIVHISVMQRMKDVISNLDIAIANFKLPAKPNAVEQPRNPWQKPYDVDQILTSTIWSDIDGRTEILYRTVQSLLLGFESIFISQEHVRCVMLCANVHKSNGNFKPGYSSTPEHTYVCALSLCLYHFQLGTCLENCFLVQIRFRQDPNAARNTGQFGKVSDIARPPRESPDVHWWFENVSTNVQMSGCSSI